MNVKAVFLDIDGTWYDHKTNQIFKENIEAVKKLQEKGIKVALCSGRLKEMAADLHVFENMNWDGYIGVSGGVVHDENLKIIYRNTYTQEQLKEIFKIAEENNFCLFSFGEYEFMTKPLNEISQKFIDQYHLKTPEVRTWKGENLTYISALGRDLPELQVFRGIEGIRFTASTTYVIDFIKENVSKAEAIDFLMNYWGIKGCDYIAFGDSINDIPMMQAATLGIAMGNAEKETKDAADLVIGPADTPAIAQALIDLRLI